MNKKGIFTEYRQSLKHKAFDSNLTVGRRFDGSCDLDLVSYGDSFDPFLFDREKIRLSKSYRRLADKTQVFPPDLHSNLRNRLIHTNDVVNLSVTLASILGLNIYLAEAIAYGHDIGHTPFGHLGERLIRNLSGKNFTHSVMSVVVAQKIERQGKGLNISYEVLEGILNHSRGAGEMETNSNVTEEATLVMYADKIAYTFSDLNDALRVGYISEEDLPEVVKYFGRNQRERNAKASLELIKESSEKGKVSFSNSEGFQNFTLLKDWMYQNVYFTLDNEDRRQKTYNELKEISSFIQKNFNGQVDPYLAISCMTDSEVKNLFKDINNGGIEGHNYGFIEIINNFLDKEVNIFDPDLNKADFCVR